MSQKVQTSGKRSLKGMAGTLAHLHSLGKTVIKQVNAFIKVNKTS